MPTDAAALRALVLAMMAERDALAVERDAVIAERDALAVRAERLEHLLRTLRRLHYGAKSERLPEAQLQLGLEDTEAAIAKVEAEAERTDPALRQERAARRRAGRGKLPAHLPRIEVDLAPEATTCPCCQAAMVVIGEDRAERLDVIPAQFRVLVTRRPKLACRACSAVVVQSPAPARLIAGGIPTEATVAHVLVARYADHLPLYRQAQIWTRQGVVIDRSTLAAWVGTAAAELAPVVARLKQIMLASARIFADETTVPVLDPGRGRTKTGYFWAIARDDRPWAAPIRRRWSTPTRPAAGTHMVAPCSAVIAASCKSMATPATRNSPTRPAGPDRARLPSAGPMSDVASTILPRPVPRRSPPRRWSASPRSIASRRRSGD